VPSWQNRGGVEACQARANERAAKLTPVVKALQSGITSRNGIAAWAARGEEVRTGRAAVHRALLGGGDGTSSGKVIQRRTSIVSFYRGSRRSRPARPLGPGPLPQTGVGSAPPFTISSPRRDFPLKYLVVGMELPGRDRRPDSAGA
jgi:hypothetical protein